MTIEPVDAPLHNTFVTEGVPIVTAVEGSPIITEVVAEQLLASLTTTVYVPAIKLLIAEVFEAVKPLGPVHEYVKLPVPPDAVIEAVPVEPPLHFTSVF